ncbi:MAG: choice-of-anchor C family protein [Phycisphaeraceae bacterium]|nr:MAG: choice-of-anchor C family protein [Phycisphaeraceae bacterium]
MRTTATTCAIRLMGALSIAGLAPAALAQDNLVRNGGFESAFVDPAAWFVNAAVGQNVLEGWTIASGDIDYIGGYWQHGQGIRSLDLSGRSAGRIEQRVEVEWGRTYRLEFMLAGNPMGDLLKHLRVEVGALSWEFEFNAAGRSYQDMGWVGHEIIFTAQGPRHNSGNNNDSGGGSGGGFPTGEVVLAFQSLNHSKWGAAVDGVSLTLVPAPGPLVLAGLGITAAIGPSRRRRGAVISG